MRLFSHFVITPWKVIVCLLICVICIICIFIAGSSLIVNERPVRSDAIIMLGGGWTERAIEASKLYKERYASKIILSDGGTRAKPSSEYAIKEIGWLTSYGVPKTSIITDLHAQSTYGNAVYTKDIMIKNHYRSAIVVSSSYHMRRAKYVFDKVYEDKGIRLTYCSAFVHEYTPNNWWTSRAGWNHMVDESTKLIGYWIRYGILNKNDGIS